MKIINNIGGKDIKIDKIPRIGITILSTILAVLLLIGSAWAATEINSCTTISEPGKYVLNQSITNSTSSTCIDIIVGGVTLDGAGYTIDGVNRNGTGVSYYYTSEYLSEDYVEIRNLTVKNWGGGISYVSDAPTPGQEGHIYNTTIVSNGIGVSIGDFARVYLEDNNVSLNRVGFNIFSDETFFYDNNVTLNDVGILLAATPLAWLSGNNVSLNKEGIQVRCSQDCRISDNTILSNSEYGITLSSSNTEIYNNTIISKSGYGLLLGDSSNNTIYNNYFDNPINAKDNGNNTWNITKTPEKNIIGGSYLGGNFWSDYTGKDLDGDGLGDTLLPYNSSGNIINGGDYLPLTVSQISAPNITSVTDLHNITYAPNYINWTWIDPAESDFDHVEVYIDNSFKNNVSKGIQFYNATGFAPDTEHTISTRTVDVNGNINQTWKNNTARTATKSLPGQDILSYYRGLGNDPNKVETTDLLKAADDWSNNITPPGFTSPITTQQLLILADEWARSG